MTMARHRMLRFSSATLSTLAFAAVTIFEPAIAQPYPSQMIRIVVASAAGTPPDIMSRIVANELGQTDGWRVLVENKAGAMQTIGGAEVLRQPADGYTLLSVAMSA